MECCHYFHWASFGTTSSMISAFGTLLTGVGAIIIAFWALKKYFRERENETKLFIDLSLTNYNTNNTNQVFLDVYLVNEGMVALHTSKRFEKGPDQKIIEKSFTLEDSVEKIKYSVELQVKRVLKNSVVYDWFDPKQYETVVEHLNLLKDIEVPDDPNHPSFFLEPKEKYHFGCWLTLEKGLYEAKVIVIGDEKTLPNDFWHRRFPFEVK
jgi:hypothetical protein